MSPLSPRTATALQAFRLMVYRKALHPEFFDIRRRFSASTDAYEIEAWLSAQAHMVRFQVEDICIVEMLTTRPGAQPRAGLLTSFPCAGERDFEHRAPRHIVYLASVQTEIVSQTLYASTFREMIDFGREQGALELRWPGSDGLTENLSLLSLQRFHREVHCQSWHLDSAAGVVVRTQAIFEADPHS